MNQSPRDCFIKETKSDHLDAVAEQSEFIKGKQPSFIHVDDIEKGNLRIRNSEQRVEDDQDTRNCKQLQAAVLERLLRDVGAIDISIPGSYRLRPIRLVDDISLKRQNEALNDLRAEIDDESFYLNPFDINRICHDLKIDKAALIKQIKAESGSFVRKRTYNRKQKQA